MGYFQALSSSLASVRSAEAERSRSLASVAAEQSRSLESISSVASVLSKSIESEASVASVQGKTYSTPDILRTLTGATTRTPSDTSTSNINTNTNTNVALVGGAVGGVLGATVLGLVGILLWRRKKGAPASPPAGQQPFTGQHPSSQPVTPASPTFSTNTSYLGGPPVTSAAQAGWHPQQSNTFGLVEGPSSSAAGRSGTASPQSASPQHTVNTWIERPPHLHQDAYGGLAPQPRPSPSSPAEGPVDPRELYSDALRASSYSVASPVNSVSGVSGSPPPTTAYSYAPPVSEKADLGKFGG